MASSNRTSSSLTSSDQKPASIYGTAWKQDQTDELVTEALRAGFRAVDTAAQPRHYQEHLVGNALRRAFKDRTLKREDIYLQTKYTSPGGQDIHNMPYYALDPLETQIRTSVASSLHNLRPRDDSDEGSYLDCLLLHSPLRTDELTLQAWKVLESYGSDRIRALGISNVTLPVLQAIYDTSSIKPSVVQNRFYADTQYDVPLRAFCRHHNITYQSFWTLTGNRKLLTSDPVNRLAEAAKVSTAVALYALVMDLGVVVLNGTTSKQHMKEDLAGIETTHEWAKANGERWDQLRELFQDLVGP